MIQRIIKLDKFKKFYDAAGGSELIKKYIYNHVLLYSITMFLLLPKNKVGFEQLREVVNERIYLKLKKKFRKILNNKTSSYNEKPKIIWFSWFQGLENAPEIVKASYKSIKEKLPDYEVRLLTEENLFDYVKLPDYIIEKWKNKIITNTHFSDIVRVNLLCNYGGTWIDGTCLVTDNIPKDIEESKIFMFRTFKPGSDGHSTNITSWFISSVPHHGALEMSQDILFEYWKHHNYLCDYFFIFYIFEMVFEVYSEDLEAMPKYSIEVTHFLLFELKKAFDSLKYNSIVKQSFIHKLTYKYIPDEEHRANTVYEYITEKDYEFQD